MSAAGQDTPRVVTITDAAGAADLAEVATLFREYQSDIGVDLCFQGFADEVASLPGDYAPPRGRLLLARVDGAPVGCAALRALAGGDAEIKRVYVRPAARGLTLGRRLTERVIAEARALGYARLLLDTLPQMAAAQQLYESLGFRDVPPYRPNPIAGARYMALAL